MVRARRSTRGPALPALACRAAAGRGRPSPARRFADRVGRLERALASSPAVEVYRAERQRAQARVSTKPPRELQTVTGVLVAPWLATSQSSRRSATATEQGAGGAARERGLAAPTQPFAPGREPASTRRERSAQRRARARLRRAARARPRSPEQLPPSRRNRRHAASVAGQDVLDAVARARRSSSRTRSPPPARRPRPTPRHTGSSPRRPRADARRTRCVARVDDHLGLLATEVAAYPTPSAWRSRGSGPEAARSPARPASTTIRLR